MIELHQPPRAAAIVNSLRAIGYSFNSAVADLIDNSIAADAKNIDIFFRTSPAYVCIVDDGNGMSHDELIDAMRHGGQGPTLHRSREDLGRYGLGLKTASLSQCRRLTVISLKHGKLSAARWDLDEVERRDDWILLIPADEELAEMPGVDLLNHQKHGTLVLWESFDRATAGEADPAGALQKLVLSCGDHLALVFHRFLAGEFSKKLTIAVNNRAVEPLDPFLRKHPFTELVGDESRTVDGQKVSVKAYILPHISKLTAADLALAGGKDHLRDMQGFYIYRNRRLIIWGTWFRLLGRDELTRLARVQVDIPNNLDDLWNLDVKKSAAFPPEAIRKLFKQIVHVVAAKSSHVFQDKRRKTDSSEVTFMWERTKSRDGIRYQINPSHPLVRAVAESLAPTAARNFEFLLEAIELSLPARSIYVDQASNESVRPDQDVLEQQLPAMLQAMLGLATSQDARLSLIRSLPHIEPFRNYPEITRTLTEQVIHAFSGRQEPC